MGNLENVEENDDKNLFCVKVIFHINTQYSLGLQLVLLLSINLILRRTLWRSLVIAGHASLTTDHSTTGLCGQLSIGLVS